MFYYFSNKKNWQLLSRNLISLLLPRTDTYPPTRNFIAFLPEKSHKTLSLTSETKCEIWNLKLQCDIRVYLLFLKEWNIWIYRRQRPELGKWGSVLSHILKSRPMSIPKPKTHLQVILKKWLEVSSHSLKQSGGRRGLWKDFKLLSTLEPLTSRINFLFIQKKSWVEN